jgi:hypothetical protein
MNDRHRVAYAPVEAPAPRSDDSGVRAGFYFLLASSVAACGVFIYLRTLSVSWAYDDVDHLNAAGDVLAGRVGYWQFVFRPHLEHLVPAVRMLFHASVKFFGVDAFPFRILSLLAHIASGVLLGLAARRYSRTDGAGVAAGLAYVVPAGFSSMWVWRPPGPFGMIGIAGALAALANRSSLGVRKARILAGAGGLFALFCENSLVPLLACPAILDEYERRREGSTKPLGPLTAFLAIVAVAWSFLSSTLYERLTGEPFSFNLRQGIPRAGFLLAVAPFRYFFPGLPLSRPGEPPRNAAIVGSLLGLAVAGVFGALLLALCRRKPAPLATVAILMAIGPVGVIGLVGLRRWQFRYEELYDADRYFFTLLIPAALLIGFVADRVWMIAAGWPRARRFGFAVLIAGSFAAELLVHRSALLRQFPRTVFDAHERRFSQLELLAGRLNDAANSLPPGRPPLHLPDSAIWFPDVHNGTVSTRLLLFGIDRSRPPRLQLGSSTVSVEDERRLNPILDAWARDLGEPLLRLSIRNGALVNAGERNEADFRNQSSDEAIVSGFYGWEGSSRWMTRRGELRLVMISPRLSLLLAAPMNAIRARHPEWKAVEIRLTLVDENTGSTFAAGTIHVEEDGVRAYDLDAPELLSRLGNARRVRLVMESGNVWRPMDVLPGSQDPRELTVQIFRVGFGHSSERSR